MAVNSLWAMKFDSFKLAAALANGDDGSHASDFNVYIIEDERTPMGIRNAMVEGTSLSDLNVVFSVTANIYDSFYKSYGYVTDSESEYKGDDFTSLDFDLEKKYVVVYKYGNIYRVRNCPMYDWQYSMEIDDSSFDTRITGWFNTAHLPAKPSTPDFTFSVSKGILTITPKDNNVAYGYAIYFYPDVTDEDLQYYAKEKTVKFKSTPSKYSSEKGVVTCNLKEDYGNYLEEGEEYRVYAYTMTWNDEDKICYAGYVSSYRFKYSTTATAIEAEEIDKASSKPVKAIVDGKMVIIKDGEMFDLNGRKL